MDNNYWARKNIRRFLLIILTCSKACATRYSSVDLNDPRNYAWPYSTFAAIKKKLGFSIVPAVPTPSLFSRVCATVETLYGYYVTELRSFVDQTQRKGLIKQAQRLLNRHLALASKFSSDSLAKVVCSPSGLAWCQFAYGLSSNLVLIKRLLNWAVYGTSATSIGQELFVQSRAAVQASKIKKLFRLIFRPKFNMAPLLVTATHANATSYGPGAIDFNW